MEKLGDIEAVSTDLKETAKDIRFDTILIFIRTVEILNRYLDIELRKYGASRARSAILNVLIARGGSMRPTDLSRELFRSKHTITRVVDGLEKEGLVIRESVGEDRRSINVTITKKGLELVKGYMLYRKDISYRALSCLDKKQMQGFKNTLMQLRKHLLQYISNPETR